MLTVRANSDVFRHLKARAESELRKGLLRFVTYAEGIAIKRAPKAPGSAGGNLKSSISSGVEGETGYLKATAPYAAYVHEGTGLFGPKAELIKPKMANQLSFVWNGALVHFKSVKGMRPRPFFKQALEQAEKDIPPKKLFGETL